MSAHFDFAAYLAEIDPFNEYEITALSGGHVNLTVRATKTMSLDTGPFYKEQSIILKYAPPFIATVGASAPFSPFRQTIEARALELLASSPKIVAAQAESEILIPRVLFHDPEDHVLVISDLGAGLLTLDEWLVPSLSPTPQPLPRTPPSSLTCGLVGRRIGILMAAIHALDVSHVDSQQFANEDSTRIIREQVVDKMAGILERYGFSGSRVENWCARIRDEFEEGCGSGNDDNSMMQSITTGRVFCMGDLWPGSIVVSPDGRVVGLVDWEFARMGRPLQDMAQLCGHLRALEMSLPSTHPTAHFTAFTEHMCGCYRLDTRWFKSSWLLNPHDRDLAMKSAFVLYFRELVYNAAERYHQKCVELGANEQEAFRKMQSLVWSSIGYMREIEDGTGNKWNQESFLTTLCFEE